MLTTQIKYFPGSEWLYIKIYGSVLATEEWLINDFVRWFEQFAGRYSINRFYYVRFMDPDYHLRMRFYLKEPRQSGNILVSLNSTLHTFREEDRIWKVETATYEPEYTRYGSQQYALIEQVFEADSWFWIHVLQEMNRQNRMDELWKPALVAVNRLMDAFNPDPEQKRMVLTYMRNGFATELREERQLRSQIDRKYRNQRQTIDRLMTEGFDDHGLIYRAMQRRSKKLAGLAGKLKSADPMRFDTAEGTGMPGLIHMSLNRAFRSKHRIQELVLVDFLGRTLTSLGAGKNDTG